MVAHNDGLDEREELYGNHLYSVVLGDRFGQETNVRQQNNKDTDDGDYTKGEMTSLIRGVSI